MLSFGKNSFVRDVFAGAPPPKSPKKVGDDPIDVPPNELGVPDFRIDPPGTHHVIK